MAIYLDGMVNHEGVEIGRQYCGTTIPQRECERVLLDLAGWRAEYLWHGRGSSRSVADHNIAYMLDCVWEGWERKAAGDDWSAFEAMIEHDDAPDAELLERYESYSSLCYGILREPKVWEAVGADQAWEDYRNIVNERVEESVLPARKPSHVRIAEQAMADFEATQNSPSP